MIRKGNYKPPSNADLAKLVRRFAEYRDVIEDGDVPDLLLIAERLEQTAPPAEQHDLVETSLDMAERNNRLLREKADDARVISEACNDRDEARARVAALEVECDRLRAEMQCMVPLPPGGLHIEEGDQIVITTTGRIDRLRGHVRTLREALEGLRMFTEPGCWCVRRHDWREHDAECLAARKALEETADA